jgi:predicted aspartyl protease
MMKVRAKPGLAGSVGRREAMLLMAALAGSPEAGRAETCSAKLVGQARLDESWGFVTIGGAIDGQPVSLLLDTGADAGLVTPEAVARLGLPRDPGRRTLVQGTGGNAPALSEDVVLRALSIGGVVFAPHAVPVGRLPALPHVAPAVVGLIGANLLETFDLELDPQHHRLGLYTMTGSAGCGPETRPAWPGAYDTVTLIRAGERRLVEVELDGHSLRALIDTGARSVILNTATAEAIGVSAASLATDPGGIGGGVDMHQVTYHWHRFASLRIGALTLRRPVITVSPIEEEADMLLGASFFATRCVWLSFGTDRLFIRR